MNRAYSVYWAAVAVSASVVAYEYSKNTSMSNGIGVKTSISKEAQPSLSFVPRSDDDFKLSNVPDCKSACANYSRILNEMVCKEKGFDDPFCIPPSEVPIAGSFTHPALKDFVPVCTREMPSVYSRCLSYASSPREISACNNFWEK